MNAPRKTFIFFGTPDVARNTLESLRQAGYTPEAVVTTPDRPVGRKHIITPPPVKIWAQENDILVMQPEIFDEKFLESLKTLNPQLFIIAAYGKILPEALIQTPALGTINVHYSLLPRWRGASPVEAAILAGDTETGVTIQQTVFKLDAGPILSQEKLSLDGSETAQDLESRLTELGSQLLVETLPRIFEQSITPVTQDETQATFCKKITKEEGEIHLSDPDGEKWRKYRAYVGWPGIFYFDENGKRIKITKARFDNETFIVEKVIPEGGIEISWQKESR